MARNAQPSLEALVKGATHVAGIHLVDGKTGEANVPDVRRHPFRAPLTLVTLARWEVGFVTPTGNPRNIRRAEDLARKDLRVVGREKGSGARRLFEQELKRTQVRPSVVSTAFGHLEVAHAIAIGAADVGIATRDAAIEFDLAFVPLTEERYDLAVPTSRLSDPRVRRLFDGITSQAFRRELEAIGYDTRSSGERVAEVAA